MSNESTNRWTMIFTGTSALCAIVGVGLVYTQTPLYKPLPIPPVLDWEQSSNNTNTKNKDGRYSSTLRVTVTNFSDHPAKDVTVVVRPLVGEQWSASSVHAITEIPNTLKVKAFKIAVIPARSKAEVDCVERLEEFPIEAWAFESDFDQYDRDAGSKRFDYWQSVSKVFTDFGSVSDHIQFKNTGADLKAMRYVADDYRSKEGKDRRAAYLKSKRLKEVVHMLHTEVVPDDTPDQ